MKKIHLVVVVAVLLAGCASAIAQASHPVVIHAGHVLDVKTGKLLTDQALVIEDGKIVSVGPAGESKGSPDAVRIDLPNATVLPGVDRRAHAPDHGPDIWLRTAGAFGSARDADRRQERAPHAAGGIHHGAQRGRRATTPTSRCATPSTPATCPGRECW